MTERVLVLRFVVDEGSALTDDQLEEIGDQAGSGVSLADDMVKALVDREIVGAATARILADVLLETVQQAVDTARREGFERGASRIVSQQIDPDPPVLTFDGVEVYVR